MTARTWLQMVMCVLIGLSAAACCCCLPNPNPPPETSDLVGTWRADYDEYFRGHSWSCYGRATGVETLTLRADGTYQQVYDNGKGYAYTSSWNEWRQQYNRIHLAGGRFYALGIEDATKLASGQLIWHTDDDGTGHPLDLDSTTGITLHVTPRWYVFTNEREVTLDYPPVCDLDSPVIVEFHRVVTPVLTPATIP